MMIFSGLIHNKKSMKNTNIKLICLTPVRNEAWILKVFLTATSLWADYIIIADQGSTDGSREIAVQYPKVILIENNNPDFNEAERQSLLINRARKIEGDKILFALDADEILSANFTSTQDWQKILHSKPGDVFWFRWANLHPDLKHYWLSKTYFPWVFHDDGIEPHGNYVRNMHSMRIPYPIEEKQMYYVNDFWVLHFQGINIQRNVSKQRFYMFVDFVNNNRNTVQLSRMYLQNKQTSSLYPISDEMRPIIDLYNSLFVNSRSFWFDEYIAERIKKEGAESFKALNIWDNEFINFLGVKDPRNFPIKMLHWYLRITQPIARLFIIRLIDYCAKRLLK
jgi:hypothetical protein